MFTKQPNSNDYVSSTILKSSLTSNLPWTCDFLDCLKLYFTPFFLQSKMVDEQWDDDTSPIMVRQLLMLDFM
jgi:hypothetical protein